jgi:hypothetical protein
MDEGDKAEARVDIIFAPRGVVLFYCAKRPGTLWQTEWDALVGSHGKAHGNVTLLAPQARKYLTTFEHPEIVIGDANAMVALKTTLAQLRKTGTDIYGPKSFLRRTKLNSFPPFCELFWTE